MSEDIWEGDELLTLASADIGNYQLNFLDMHASGLEPEYMRPYPSDLAFIAFNDDQKATRWGFIYYTSLDYIESEQNFIKYIKTNVPIEW